MDIFQSLSKLFKPKPEAKELEKFFEKAGREFNIRRISENDRDEIVHGFESISNETRHKRFLTYKKSLTESEVDFFSHPDFVNHFAYGIQEIEGDKKTPFGISRFVCDHDNREQAEFAIALSDKYQGMKLGLELMGFTVKEARENGVKVLYGITLPDNEGILKLMKKFGEVKISSEGNLRKLSLLL